MAILHWIVEKNSTFLLLATSNKLNPSVLAICKGCLLFCSISNELDFTFGACYGSMNVPYSIFFLSGSILEVLRPQIFWFTSRVETTFVFLLFVIWSIWVFFIDFVITWWIRVFCKKITIIFVWIWVALLNDSLHWQSVRWIETYFSR
jgi:hypothetical protein